MFRGSGRHLLASLLVAAFVVSLVPVVPAKPPATVEYEFLIDCPQREIGKAFAPPRDGENAKVRSPLECPIRADDEDDIMGSPSVAVDWRDPSRLILASLHGSDGDGPTERSRGGGSPGPFIGGRQPFTTFLSEDHGGTWYDRPFFAPSRLGRAFGEHPQIYNDLLGHVFVGSLYSSPTDAPSGWNYTIVPQRFDSFGDAMRHQTMSGDYHAKFVPTYFPDSLVDQFWFQYDPVTNTMTIVWNERIVFPSPAPASSVAAGLVAPLNPPAAADGAPEVEPFSAIGVAWSSPRYQEEWHRVGDRSQLIGPCIKTTNPVVSEGWIYIGCMIDVAEQKNHTKYKWDKDPQPGQIDIFRFEPGYKNVTHLGAAPVKGGNPKLGVRSDGRMVLFTTGVVGDAYRLVGAWGRADPRSNNSFWEPPKQYGDDILRPQAGRRILESNIQDLILREYSGAVHLLLKLRYQSLGISLDNPTAALQPVFEKVVTAIHEDYGVLKTFNLDIGNRVNRTSLRTDSRNPDAVFNDLSDDLFELPPDDFSYGNPPVDYGPTYQREFFAVGDYGHIIFAELIEHTNLRHAAAGPPAVAAPAAASVATNLGIATVILPIAGTALAGLLALKLALNRRKDPMAAFVKGGK